MEVEERVKNEDGRTKMENDGSRLK